MTLLTVLLITIAATVVHVSLMAAVPVAFGIRPKVVSYGLGPLLFERGMLQVRGVLLGGYVTLYDSRDSDLDPEQLAVAIDRRPMWLHATVGLLPHLMLLVVGSGLSGENPISVIKTIWTQFVLCAIGPLSTAQVQLESFISFVDSSSLIVISGWMLALVASLALLPVGSAAGGQVLLNAISGRRRPSALVHQLNVWTTLLHIVFLMSWGVAIALFVWRSLVS